MKDVKLKPCPRCWNESDKLESGSIFDLKTKICKSCAFHEKAVPLFNWIKGVYLGVRE